MIGFLKIDKPNIFFRIYFIFILSVTGCGNTKADGAGLEEVPDLKLEPADTPLPRLKVTGSRITDPEGRIVVLKGLNICDITILKEEGHWTEDYIKKAASWGAKLIRIIIHPGNYRKYGRDYFFTLSDEAVRWSEKYGIYTIIDWHSEGNLAAGKFEAPADVYRTSKEETISFWKSVAERYKNEPAMAFYEIFNEPTAGYMPWDRMNWSDWRVLADEIIGEIIKINPDAIPIVGGIAYASDLRAFKSDPLRNKGIVLSIHPYPGNIPEPWEENWEKYFGYLSKDYPLMFTEFGFDPCSTVLQKSYKAGIDYGKRILAYAKKRDISWTAFVFYNGPYWPMPLFENWQTYKPTLSGVFFKNELINGH